MRRRIVQAILMIALALLPFAAAAQTTVTGSGFQVQNLNESQPANIVITYYDASGNAVVTQNGQVPAGGSLTYLNGQGGTVAMAAPAGFRGSVVISSDQPIAAITNLVGANIGGTYGGFSGGGQFVNLPLIVRNNAGFNTTITVQNTGSAPATVNITYTPGVAGNTGVTDSATIAPGASATFSQGDKTELGERFVGSARVDGGASGSIVAVVNQESGTQLLTYNGFSAGAQSINVPLLVANNFGGVTGLQVQNIGSAQTTVTVTYSANSVTTPGTAASVCGTPPATSFTLAAGASKTLIQAGGDTAEGFDPFFATCRYVGSATVTSDDDGAGAGTTGQPLVAIVNQIAGTSASAYESFSVTTGTIKVPLVQANNFGIFSGIQVQNTGSSSASVTVTYGPNTISPSADPNACPTPTARTQSIPAGASFTFIQSGAGAAEDGFDSQFETCRYVGSATITGGTIAAIVNQASPSAGDSLFTYNAFNQ